MSKEKPEAGDVWGIACHFTRVLFVSENAVRFISPEAVGRHPMIYTWDIETFVNTFDYLGKSKVNLEELFDVKD